MSDEKLKGDGVDAEGKPLFVPTRYIHREKEALAVRIDSEEAVKKFGGNVGDWYVTDDRGISKAIPDEEFQHFYMEYEGASWPGKLAIQLAGNLTAHGCKAVLFKANAVDGPVDRQLNAWAEAAENYGKLVSYIQPLAYDTLLVFYTNTLSDRERAEQQEVAIETRETIDRKHRTALENQASNMNAALEQQKKDREAKEAEAKELERLAALGKKHEKNCGKGKK